MSNWLDKIKDVKLLMLEKYPQYCFEEIEIVLDELKITYLSSVDVDELADWTDAILTIHNKLS